MLASTKRITELENIVEKLKSRIDNLDFMVDQQKSYILLLNNEIAEIEKKKIDYMG